VESNLILAIYIVQKKASHELAFLSRNSGPAGLSSAKMKVKGQQTLGTLHIFAQNS